MTRQTVTNAALTAMINSRFAEGDELDGDCRQVKISGVQLYVGPDEAGCNWDVQIYNGPEPCRHVFRTVVEKFRRHYSLTVD